jgi:hypothetical protein
MVDLRRSFSVICVAVLAISFASVDEIGVSRRFMTLFIHPFGEIVANILEHTSVNWFCHRRRETSDIVISVPAVPAVLTACSSEWH